MDKYFLVLQINIINIGETRRYRLSLLLKSALLAIFTHVPYLCNFLSTEGGEYPVH